MKALVVLALMASLAVGIAARIEVLNHRAGDLLPMPPLPEGTSKRRLPSPNERWWRMWKFGPQDVDRPLTAAERQAMDADLRRWRAENDLDGVLSTWGLLQFPLCLALLVAAGLAARQQLTLSTRAAAACFAAIAAVCLYVAAVARDYPSGLSW